MNANEIVDELRNDSFYGCATYHEKCAELEYAAADMIESLQSQLAESQQRERAAVEDLRENADRKCYVCAHWVNGRCTIPERDCAGFYRWKWRGPVEAKEQSHE